MSRQSDIVRCLEGVKLIASSLFQETSPYISRRIAQAGQHTSDLSLSVLRSSTATHPRLEHKTPPRESQNIQDEVEACVSTQTAAKVEDSKESQENQVQPGLIVEEIEESSENQAQPGSVLDHDQTVQWHLHEPKWTEKRVPSTPLARIFGFGSLAAKLAVGTATEAIKNMGTGNKRSALITDSNTEKLVETLCTMRGAALKLGQMLSIQDEALVPSALSAALDRVRQGAHIMPTEQLHGQLEKELGTDWRKNFKEFDEVPIAAASIGQVHRAVLKDGQPVAMKIQYPGVAESIDSDLLNLKRLVTYTNILPKGLYIDEIIRVGKEELTEECDYTKEAEKQKRFAKFIQHEHGFVVPKLYDDFCSSRILTSELVAGVPVDKITNLSQETRNSVAQRILFLTIQELFQWRFMQTDPNWSNFMYNASSDILALVDFGAARSYDKPFVDEYFRIVWAAANDDTETLMSSSLKLKFLTGDESKKMIDAHVSAGMVVGEPFRSNEPFDFQASRITERLASYGEVFMHDRLTPPPQEVYSLHRKLAGAFLMCMKLRAVIPCRSILQEVYENYDFDGSF